MERVQSPLARALSPARIPCPSNEPAPERKQHTTWKTFLKAHWDVLAAVDFTTIEVWGKNGLVTVYLLFVMELATRRVHFAGCTTTPDEIWMKQIAGM